MFAEADMAAVDEGNGVSDDVLEIDSTPGTLKSPSAAALNDGMLEIVLAHCPGRFGQMLILVVARLCENHGPPTRRS